MPYVWVPNDLFLEHQGVQVYHVYRNESGEEPRRYWYGLTADAPDGGSDPDDPYSNFDVRRLSTWKPEYNDFGFWSDEETEAIRTAIQEAIETKELESP